MFKQIGLAASLMTLGVACGGGGGGGGVDAGGGSDGTGTGPAATLKCTSSGMNAFETYKAAGFLAVNTEIFTEVTAELGSNGSANLGNSFNEVGTGGSGTATADSIGTFQGKLAAFLVYVYGGPSSIKFTDGVTYDGVQDMKTAHTGLAITDAQFQYFVAHVVVSSLEAKGVTAEDVSSCFAPALDASFEATIVGH